MLLYQRMNELHNWLIFFIHTYIAVVVFQLLKHFWLFTTPWTAARQASLSLIISQTLPKFMSIELMRPSNRLIFCHTLILCLQSFPSSGSFPVSQFFASGGQSFGVSALASVLPESIQGWFPLRLTGLISLLSKGLSRNFSGTIVWKHQLFSVLPSLLSSSHIHT